MFYYSHFPKIGSVAGFVMKKGESDNRVFSSFMQKERDYICPWFKTCHV